MFLTAIVHRGLRNCFFLTLHLLFPISIWTIISLFLFGLLFLFYLDFYFPFLFGLLLPFLIWNFLFECEFQFEFQFFFISFSHQSRSQFGFLPNFFTCENNFLVPLKRIIECKHISIGNGQWAEVRDTSVS